jgi:hypothetical protein
LSVLTTKKKFRYIQWSQTIKTKKKQGGGYRKEPASARGSNELGEEHEFKDPELTFSKEKKSPLEKPGIPHS